MNASSFSLADLLFSEGPAPDRADKMGLYGQFVGAWEMDAVVTADDGQKSTGHGRIRFAWALEGRAIQDVWILPGRFYGTTLRVYDPALDAWHILWTDPLRQFYSRQIGRPQGADIIQVGKTDAGTTVRWSFSDITPDAFFWRGERSPDDGVTWQTQSEFRARRLGR